MSSKKLIKQLFNELSRQVSGLSDIELSKIEDGTHELALKVVKKKSQSISTQELSS